MNTTWWRKATELDDEQKKFIKLPLKGRISLSGPPGSGKTNLLMLRAQFVSGAGEKNVLIITYTNVLANFIRSGASATREIKPDQVKTYHSWAYEHVRQFLGKDKLNLSNEFNDADREMLCAAVVKANESAPVSKLYSAIFVDEAQDFTIAELKALLSLSDNVCICGDERQGIYRKDGMAVAAAMGLDRYQITSHYRIGHRIAQVADRLMPAKNGEPSLEATCNYNSKLYGTSTAELHECGSRDEQFEKMRKSLLVEVDAFRGDRIGVLCGKKSTLEELRERFAATELGAMVQLHGLDGGEEFDIKRPISAMTIHASKGTEFRAVHVFGAEDLKGWGLNHREIGYTAITRAKTALNAYRTGDTNKPFENAFAQPKHVELDELFPE